MPASSQEMFEPPQVSLQQRSVKYGYCKGAVKKKCTNSHMWLLVQFFFHRPLVLLIEACQHSRHTFLKKKKKRKKTATDKTASNLQNTIAPRCTVAAGTCDVLQGSGINTVQAQEAQGRTQQRVNKNYNSCNDARKDNKSAKQTSP